MDYSPKQPITRALQRLIEEQPSIGDQLLKAMSIAKVPGVSNLDDYCFYVDKLVTRIPDNSRSLTNQAMGIYFISDQLKALRDNSDYEYWLNGVAEAWGQYLDTPESTQDLDQYYKDPSYNIDDYQPGPSGWRSFNQFFARVLRPGKRPVTGLCDDKIVVSPADSMFMAVDDINENSEIDPKGVKLKIADLLEGTPYADSFAGGTFTHSFLNTNDYHRYHVPVRGAVAYLKHIPGEVQVEFKQDKAGKIIPEPSLTAGYLFHQERGLMILESPLGLVAVLPIGMAQISSVALTPDIGAKLYKGQEFGYFQFGGSDVITMFQAGKVELTAKKGKHYLQGEQIGNAK